VACVLQEVNRRQQVQAVRGAEKAEQARRVQREGCPAAAALSGGKARATRARGRSVASCAAPRRAFARPGAHAARDAGVGETRARRWCRQA